MKGLHMLAWLLVCSAPAVLGGALELKQMIEEVTGKDALTYYGFYGCYCGLGGQGTPKDATDRCCWEHDRCYALLERQGCYAWIQYYKHRFSRGVVTCEPGPRCQEQVCACDQKFTNCLKQNLRTYNLKYRFVSKLCCI